jgi:hypothetical protein
VKIEHREMFIMASSLAQLVKMGLLDNDFLEIDDNQVLSQVEAQLRAHEDAHEAHEDVHEAYEDVHESREAHESHDAFGEIVTYTDRDPTPTPTSAPDDLEYYQKITYHWLYSSPSYGWWHFAKDDNETLEYMYRSGQRHCILHIGHNKFTIDFNKMQQQGDGRPRHLLRSPTLGDIVLKGVAGSKIAKRDILENSVDQSHFGAQAGLTPIEVLTPH